MRIPGVSVVCLAASLLVARSPRPDLSGKRRIGRSKSIRKRDMKPGSADHQSSEAKDLVVFDILRSRSAPIAERSYWGAISYLWRANDRFASHAPDPPPFGLPAQRRHRSDPARRKHSALSAVVVRFSRARKRYERQGVLVEESALEQAGEQCSADAEQRSVRRERAEIYRDKQDQVLAMRMAESIGDTFPGCPPEEAQAIAARTSVRAAAEWVGPPPGEH